MRVTIVADFITRERPPCRPTTSASMPCIRRSSTFWLNSRVVISTSAPRPRSTSTSGRNTSTCAGPVMSIQTRIGSGV
jgi:hypothetical protein